jgi:hypothetical protein
MTVNLSQRGQEMLETAMARGLGRTPEEIVEHALETITGQEIALSDQERNGAGRLLPACSHSARNITSGLDRKSVV